MDSIVEDEEMSPILMKEYESTASTSLGSLGDRAVDMVSDKINMSNNALVLLVVSVWTVGMTLTAACFSPHGPEFFKVFTDIVITGIFDTIIVQGFFGSIKEISWIMATLLHRDVTIEKFLLIAGLMVLWQALFYLKERFLECHTASKET